MNHLTQMERDIHAERQARLARMGLPDPQAVRRRLRFLMTELRVERRPRRVLKFVEQPAITPREVADTIIEDVAIEHQVPMADIVGPSRKKAAVSARREAVRRVHEAFPDWSMPMLGRTFNRDHTTILNLLGKLRRNKAYAKVGE